jgi:hypothetical protein
VTAVNSLEHFNLVMEWPTQSFRAIYTRITDLKCRALTERLSGV